MTIWSSVKHGFNTAVHGIETGVHVGLDLGKKAVHTAESIERGIVKEVKKDAPVVGKWTGGAIRDGYKIVYNVGNRILNRTDEAAGSVIGLVRGVGNNMQIIFIAGAVVLVVFLFRK
jgi:hypothetical protein